MAQKKTSSLALTQEDRTMIAQVREILERENKGLEGKFTMIAIFRVVLNFFLDAKRKPTSKK